jgi:ABC-type multidrug transport system permease subunit
MTRERLWQLWRNLTFWQRLLFESVFCTLTALVAEALISGSPADYTDAVVGGLCFGMLFALIDHAFFASSKRSDEKSSGESPHG